MALDAASSLAQFDLVGVKEDVSDVVAEILLGETSLLSRIGISGEAYAATHSWLENSLNATAVTGAEDMDASETGLDVSTNHGLRVRVGTLLRDRAKGKTEVMQVTAISSDTLTVTRGYGSTSGETHSNGATYDIVGQPRQSGADASSDTSTVRASKSSVCQIFEKTVSVSGDAQAVLKWGVADEIGKQAGDRMMELLRELNMSIIMGIENTPASDSAYRSMGGLIEKLTAANGNSSSTDEDLTPEVLNDLNQLAYDDGGTPNLLVCNQDQMRVISRFDADKIRRDPNNRVAGQFINRFLTELGNELEIVLDRWCPPDTVMLLDSSRVTVMPLTTRAFFMQELGLKGDKREREIIGDYTIEVRNALQAHAIHTNLTIPS